MIPQAYINAWRSQAPWRSDSMVEQDLLICRTLVELFRQPVLAEHLAFRGGTALHKLYFSPARRYSEDIDLVQIQAGPIGPLFDTIHDALSALLGKPKRKQGPGVATLTYRILPELPPAVPMRLKVEINSREHFAALGVRKRNFAIGSRAGAKSRRSIWTNCWAPSCELSTNAGKDGTCLISGWA